MSLLGLLAQGYDCLIQVLARCTVADVLALTCTCRELSSALSDDRLWQELAEQKWGRHVRELAQVAPGGWAAWTKHRLSWSSRALSPLDLVQEHYQSDAFQHLVSCALCSRTTGGPVVREAIRRFIELFPTPSAVLDASEENLLEVIRPLGLPSVRLAAVQGMARDFLATDWESPQEFKHCGPFVADSWRIFCRGYRSLQGIEDKNLQRYVRWVLSGHVEEKGKGSEERDAAAAAGGRKRKAEKPAEAGTLRSGRRRDAPANRSNSSDGGGSAAGERRTTRAAAAAASQGAAEKAKGAGHAAGKQGKARKGERSRPEDGRMQC